MAERVVLYLLPGLLCDKAVWAAQAAALASDTDIRVPRYHGFDSIGDMAAAVLDGAPARFAMAGHSMGGRVALEVMRRAPERVSRLMLLDTGIHPRRDGEAEKRQVLVDLARRDGMAALAQVWLPPMLHPDHPADSELMARLTAMVCRATPDQFAGQVRALLDRPDPAAQLAGIDCPVTLVCGRQDRWSPLAQHEDIQRRIPGSRLVVIEDSGHMTPVEQPDAVTMALRDWLAATPGYGTSVEKTRKSRGPSYA